MSKQISRQAHTGLGIETTRGTAIAPSIWMPRLDYKLDDKTQKVVDESSVGSIADAVGSDVTQKYSEGELGGIVDANSIGLLLKLLFGQASSGAVSGQAGAYDHTFNLLETGQHPVFTLSVKDTNDSLAYSLCSMQDFELNAEINNYVTFKTKFRGNSKATAGTLTPAYSTTILNFLPQNITFKLADTLAGISGATPVEVKKVSISFKKNIEDDQVLGNIQASDRLNKQFVAEGSFEIIAKDNSFRDMVLSNPAKYAELKLTNPATIGVSTNPSVAFTMYKVMLDEVANKVDNNDFYRATIKFKAFYSLADLKVISAVVRNTTTSY